MRRLIFTVLLVLSTACWSQAVPPRLTMQWQALAERIADRLDLQPGEQFLAVAHPGLFDELIPYLRYEVMKAGAVDLGVLDVLAEPVPENWSEQVLRDGGLAARSALAELLEGVDASIMLPGATPSHPVYAALQDLMRQGRHRTIHFHWLQNGSAIPLPGQPLPAVHALEANYQRAIFDTDYAALAAHQRRFVQAMRDGEVRVTSEAGTDIRFRIGNRPVNFQDGDATRQRTDKGVVLVDREIELPAGAIRVAPLEESVHGTIVFPPSQWSGKPVLGLRLGFESGKVTAVSADSGREYAEAEMRDAGPAGRAFREFALGFNPLLAVPETTPWIPYYGYGAGVVRLSLGDNSELNGNVGGGYVRWNFFTDTTVSIDGDVWVRDGKFVK
ncbi:MAG: aminopeptidase [Woeseiaceae bacterium]|nr:aminopeptidase [Woeseiaceae bacterium]